MPAGVISNVLCVVLGGWLGSLLGDRMSNRLKQQMTNVFGVCAMSMGITTILQMKNMPAVIFAVIAGTMLGTVLNIDGHIRSAAESVLGRLHIQTGPDDSLLVTALVLFCCSGTGIYGSMVSGMTGDHNILIAKSVLDFFTAMIFACQLKKSVMLMGIPQLVIMLALFFGARLILPLTTAAMIDDFRACGGIMLLATGFTIMKVKDIPIANMIPALVLVFPASALWMQWIAPLL